MNMPWFQFLKLVNRPPNLSSLSPEALLKLANYGMRQRLLNHLAGTRPSEFDNPQARVEAEVYNVIKWAEDSDG